MTAAQVRPDAIAFTPDESVSVHEEGAIKLICAAFRSHDDGLPEWVKNSSDMYVRRDVPPAQSVVVVLLRDGSKSASAIVGCLDFGGMTTADIEQKFRNWADPDAAGNSAAVEGGHGNGGKCYMTQLFDSHSYLHTLSGGRGNRYGFKGGSFKPGYFPSPALGRGYKVEDPKQELSEALAPLGLAVHDLPHAAQAAFEKAQGFTLILGVGAKALVRHRIPAKQWVENLGGHQQMVRSLQRTQVYVLHNGTPLPTASPLQPEKITPIAGAEAPRVRDVPSTLIDPKSEEEVQTGSEAGKSRLILHTSSTSMSYRRLKPRHTINGWSLDGRSTGFWEVPALSRAGYANKIYGDLHLDALSQFVQNDRRNHSDAPLTRAVRAWVSQQVEDYSAEFVKLDRLQASKEERDEIKRLNDQLNSWKNRFLEREFGGVGDGGKGGDGSKQRYRLPRGEVVRVHLSASHEFAGQGVTFRPNLDFFDGAGNRVRAIPFEWESSEFAVATIDNDLNMITTHSPGSATICVVCKDSGVRSNSIVINVVDIVDVDLEPPEIEVRAGSRTPLVAKVRTRSGDVIQGIYLIWTEDNPSIVSVGSSGMLFGLSPGDSQVVAGDNQVLSARATRVRVVEASEKGKDGGSGFPKILLSEIDDDPFGEKPVVFNESDPPVHQRTQDVDHNIWWINMGSPLARRYFDAARGGGTHSKEWRVYMLERYIEVMVKILLTYDFQHGQDLSFETMLRRWEEESVAMQQRAVGSLQAFLDGGEVVPETPVAPEELDL